MAKATPVALPGTRGRGGEGGEARPPIGGVGSGGFAIELGDGSAQAVSRPGHASSHLFTGVASALWLAATLLVLLALDPASAFGAAVGPTTGFAVAALAAWTVVTTLPRNADGSRLARTWLICLTAVLGIVVTLGLVAGLGRGSAGPLEYALASSMLTLAALAELATDLRSHVRGEAIEVGSDILLGSVVIGGWVYLMLSAGHGAGGSFGHAVLTAALGASGVALFVGSAVLALWWPSRTHLAMLAGRTVVSAAAIAVAFSRQFDPSGRVAPAAQLLTLTALGAISVALTTPSLQPGAAGTTSVIPRFGSRIRPWLLAGTLAGACVFLGSALIARRGSHLDAESAFLVAAVASIVGLRTLGNQRSMTVTNRRLQGALREREEAVASLRTVVEELAGSEQRLRGLLATAVDGVVELGPGDVVVQANDAFLTMIGVEPRWRNDIPRTWQELAERAGAGKAFAALLETGHAILPVGGRDVHLEARASLIPTDPPGTLLLVRDVTANKVAEQTIRTLFQFLQDRDEDRTRYLRRTNLAIEAERNKVARDLHDGPIQGVAAASLSLEAVKLMVEAGQHARAAEMLALILSELREETENLRRLMSDLRPPLLDERGLVPAVRELGERFQTSTGIVVQVRASSDGAVPSEVETIAYRVIQEALSNVKKHSAATGVAIRIQSTKGSLDVEIQDDGCGFDASEAREFLRKGKVGLASMRERTELGSGTFTIRSRAGGGTTVNAALPFDLLAPARS